LPASSDGYTFIPVFAAAQAEMAIRRLRAALNPGCGVRVEFVVPPTTGVELLAAQGELGERLDSWWASQVGFETLPVVLMPDQPGLAELVRGLDAEFVIGVGSTSAAERYRDLGNVRPVISSDPETLVGETIRLYTARDEIFLPGAAGAPSRPVEPEESRPGPAAPSEMESLPRWREPRPQDTEWMSEVKRGGRRPAADPPPGRDPFSEDVETGWMAEIHGHAGQPLPPPQPGEAALQPPAPPHEAAAAPPGEGPAPQAPGPVLAPHSANGSGSTPADEPGQDSWRWDGRAWRRSAMTPAAPPPATPAAGPENPPQPPAEKPASGVLATLRGFGFPSFRSSRISLDPDIAYQVMRLVDAPAGRKPITVVFAGVKGGTGNTTNVAAAGSLYGEALAPHSRTAGLIDANIVNADLALATAEPDGSWMVDPALAPATVFELIGLAARGKPFPDPLQTTVPGLVIYPEKPGVTEGYTETQLDYLRARLGERHDILIVDCAKQWPDFATSAGITVAGWIRLADVVVVGCQSAVLPMYNVVRFLQAASLQDRGCVVTYKAGRQSGALPEMRRALSDLRALPNVRSVVEIPEDDSVNVVRIKGKPITEVKGSVRASYVRMAGSILDAVAAQRQQM
jgi:hypothetical protein